MVRGNALFSFTYFIAFLLFADGASLVRIRLITKVQDSCCLLLANEHHSYRRTDSEILPWLCSFRGFFLPLSWQSLPHHPSCIQSQSYALMKQYLSSFHALSVQDIWLLPILAPVSIFPLQS